jgi:predicted RNA-binding Zn-ribbon protein involved in translation (DUF1610 family)
VKVKNFLNNSIACPKCGSNLIIITTTSYPYSFECKKCGNLFLKIPKSLVDE